MFTTRRLAATLVLPLLVAAHPLPEPKPHVIDKAHSEINFVADSRLLSAHGFFGKWDADVKLDATKWENSTVAITIDVASINTRVERRDGHLKSADFFDVEKHPNITFKSVSIKQTGPNKLDITGDLTVRGTTKRIVVPASTVFYEGGAGRFRGTFAINRRDYGVAYDSKVNPIQNEVQVQWDMALAEPKPAAK
ncbi:MAG: YceI family protein [Gemmatimonas sp.]|jgi:polyisoprenoid-binding protein YceI|uniref:YceI family protein n=1 Tax=Gemmatimonas sp. TaxID=1962908 RepID=UPI0031C55E0D|nr:YceI family protein [Gemmatimonas sp.]